jgi:dephospho-CoA kinase
MGGEVDRIVAVVSPSETRAARIAARHGIPAEEAAARVRSQADEREKARRAHFVIENTGTLEDLEARARAVWDAIRSGGTSA